MRSAQISFDQFSQRPPLPNVSRRGSSKQLDNAEKCPIDIKDEKEGYKKPYLRSKYISRLDTVLKKAMLKKAQPTALNREIKI